jgi:glycosyltransferase involved in cell wall biosynthesis
LAAVICHIPIILHTYHGHVLRGYFRSATTRAFLAVERVLARASDRLVAVSPRVRQELLELRVGRPGTFVVIPLGLDLERFAGADRVRGQLRRELSVGADVALVGIVARMVPIKAHEIFLEAAREVAGRKRDVRFVLVGDGERRLELEALVERLGIHDRCVFLSWRQDLDRVYADLDVVALSSRNEGSPVALIEAMAAGRAVVSTDVGGVADVVKNGETGLLVPPEDPKAFGAALLRLLDDRDLRARLGERGRARALANYTADRLLSDTDGLYAELAAAKGLA